MAWEGSLARAFSWIPSQLRLQLCQLTCSDAAVNNYVDRAVELITPGLRPTPQVIKTIVYQTLYQVKRESPTVGLNRANHPLTYIILPLIPPVFLLSLSICVFAVSRRYNAENSSKLGPLVACTDRLKRESNTKLREFEGATCNSNGQMASFVRCRSRIEQNRERRWARCQELQFSQCWLIACKTEAEKDTQSIYAKLLDRISILETEEGSFLTQRKSENKAILECDKALEEENTILVRCTQQPLHEKEDLVTDKTRIPQIVKNLQTNQQDLDLERSKLSEMVKTLEKKSCQRLAASKQREEVLIFEKEMISKQVTQMTKTAAVVRREEDRLQSQLRDTETELLEKSNDSAELKVQRKTLQTKLEEFLVQHEAIKKYCITDAEALKAVRTTLDAETRRYEGLLKDLKEENSELSRDAQRVKTGHMQLRSTVQNCRASCKSFGTKVQSAHSNYQKVSKAKDTLEKQLYYTEAKLEVVSNKCADLAAQKELLLTTQEDLLKTLSENAEIAKTLASESEILKAQYRKQACDCKALGQRLQQMGRALPRHNGIHLLEIIPGICKDVLGDDVSDEIILPLRAGLTRYLEPWSNALNKRAAHVGGVATEIESLSSRMSSDANDEVSIPSADDEEDAYDFGVDADAEDDYDKVTIEAAGRKRRRHPKKRAKRHDASSNTT